jgi:hypothetical protein
MEIGWTDVGSGGYILVSCAHSNTSLNEIGHSLDIAEVFFYPPPPQAEIQYRAHTQKQCVMCNVNILPLNIKVSL